ncbi:DUF222 domain-containing protein, partial [Mycolicibacterium monacense]|uniref:DUF222 domain-containing protein n=1 Tax=Mycolicibacterium monacense TaxID=85693 RepID=UPI003A599177
MTRTALITDPTLMAAVDTDLAAQITSWGPQSEKKTFAAIDAIVETHDPGALRRGKDAENDRGLQFGFISDAAGFMTVWARMYAPDGAAFEQRVTDMAHTAGDAPKTRPPPANWPPWPNCSAAAPAATPPPTATTGSSTPTPTPSANWPPPTTSPNAWPCSKPTAPSP